MTTREQQKQALYNQYLDEDFIRRVQQQKQNRLRQAPKTAYSALSTIGDTGKMMSNSSNPNIAKLGSNMYKYSGKEGLDNLKSSLFDKVNSFSNPQSPSAATNTIANAASPNMAATPTITNPASTSLASEFGGAATPTLSNPTAGTTLANFGTQGTTALNGGALASSSPLTGAIASEASGAGLGAANAGLGALGTEAATTAGAGSLAGAGTATAGTGAAMGGAGAAGAAGTGAAAGAMGALGAVAAPLAVGYMIWNMINGAKQKKNQEAIELGQKATAENEQLANEGTQEAMQALGQSTDAKREQLKNEINQGVSGDLPNLPGTRMVQDTLPPEMVQMPGGGVGAASDITQEPETNQADVLSGNVERNQTDNDGLKQNLMGFFGDLGKGYAENNSTPLSMNNFGQNTYTTKEQGIMPTNQEVDAYADQLRKDKISDDVINAFLTEGKNSGNKDIAQWVDAHKDMRNEDGSWKPTEYERNVEHKKGIGYKLGEGLGTLNRIASNPITQGLASTAFWLKDGQPFGYSLAKGLEYGANKARSDAYRRMITKDNSASLFGGYSEKDLNAHTNQLWRDGMLGVNQQRADNDTQRVKNQGEHYVRQDEINSQRAKTDQKYKEGMLNIHNQRLDIARTKNLISQMGQQLKVNQQNNKDNKAAALGKDFTFYINKVNDPNTSAEQRNYLEGEMVSKYQGDFYKLLDAHQKAHKQ